MAVRWLDGFQWATVATSTSLETIFQEKYDAANLDAGSTKGDVAAGPGPSNTLRLGSSTSDLIRVLITGDPDEIYIAFRLKQPANSSTISTDVVRIRSSSANEHFSLNFHDNVWRVNRTGSTQLNVFAPTNYYAGEWNHIELYVKVGNSPNGAYEVRINGETVASDTGIDTQNFNAGIGDIQFTNPNSTTGGGWQLRDLVIKDATGTLNNSWTGQDKHVYQVLPDGDTATEDWSLSTGSDSYALVDDVDRDNATYLESSTTADKTLFGLAATGSEQSIDCVAVSTTAALDSGTTTEQFNNVIVSNVTELDGATNDVSSTTFLQYHDYFDEDPDTSSAWTSGAIDALLSGVEYI